MILPATVNLQAYRNGVMRQDLLIQQGSPATPVDLTGYSAARLQIRTGPGASDPALLDIKDSVATSNSVALLKANATHLLVLMASSATIAYRSARVSVNRAASSASVALGKRSAAPRSFVATSSSAALLSTFKIARRLRRQVVVFMRTLR